MGFVFPFNRENSLLKVFLGEWTKFLIVSHQQNLSLQQFLNIFLAFSNFLINHPAKCMPALSKIQISIIQRRFSAESPRRQDATHLIF